MPLQLGLESASPCIAKAARDDGSDGQNAETKRIARRGFGVQFSQRTWRQCKLTARDLATAINTDTGLWQRADGNRKAT